MSFKLSICIVLLAVLCCYTQGAFARQQLRDRQEQAQGALESTNTKNNENQLTETKNEAANHIGELSRIETVLRRGTQDKDDDDTEDKDDVDGTRRRRGRRGRRRNRRRRGRGRRRGRRGGRRRRGRRGGRRRRNRRRG